jgi:hypothetical protein
MTEIVPIKRNHSEEVHPTSTATPVSPIPTHTNLLSCRLKFPDGLEVCVFNSATPELTEAVLRGVCDAN